MDDSKLKVDSKDKKADSRPRGKAAMRALDNKKLMGDKNVADLRADQSVALKSMEPLKQSLADSGKEVNDSYPNALEQYDETKKVDAKK